MTPDIALSDHEGLQRLSIQMRQGREGAYQRFVATFAPPCRTLLVRHGWLAEAAEDQAVRLLLIVTGQIHTFTPSVQGPFAGWVLRNFVTQIPKPEAPLLLEVRRELLTETPSPLEDRLNALGSDFRVSESHETRITELHQLAEQRPLTEREMGELEWLLESVDQVMLRRARALSQCVA